MAINALETASIDNIYASEKYRLQTFSDLLNIPSITRHQLALAGFVYQETKCLCPQCGILIDLQSLDNDKTYASNYFRKLHRRKVSHLGKRCPFLSCRSDTNIDDLHSSTLSPPGAKVQWDDAELPEFSDYYARVETFRSWPHFQTGIKPCITAEQMAMYGFYFSGPDDGVTCFYCGNTLVSWFDAMKDTNSNIIKLEHARFFPCRFITYTTSVKFVVCASYSHVVSEEERCRRAPIIQDTLITESYVPQSIDECLSTFENWPLNAPISSSDLARTGFYYLGDGLSVKCFMCQLEVDDWQYGMTALGTHKHRQSNCELIQAILSTNTGELQSVNEKWRLNTLEGLSFETDDDQRLCRELAACGFYRVKDTQNIRCAFCGVLFELNKDMSVMYQHRALAKRLRPSAPIDCLLVRAQCPTNITIPEREPFPEYPQYKSIFERIKSFDIYEKRHRVPSNFVHERAEAGFFLETRKLMRCFQCGNSLRINVKKEYETYPTDNLAKLHAHFYPTCEWVRQILGVKYTLQVLLDRRKLNDFDYQRLYRAQLSRVSSCSTTDLLQSASMASNGSDHVPVTESNASDYSGESDDEGCEVVASPQRARFMNSLSLTSISTPSLPISPSSDGSSNLAVETCTETLMNECNNIVVSPIQASLINPFQQLHSPLKSPSFEIMHTDTSPIDLNAFYASESHRLESFKKQNLTQFGECTVEELAYSGFYLNSDGKSVKCPWCSIEIAEQRFLKIVNERPALPGSPLNDEPWTAMRVHRHENGQFMGKDYPWCQFVRRESDVLYLNVMMNDSFMHYPEYPSYSAVEKRIHSFDSNWNYPGGSLLSKVSMAEAGFIYIGDEKVCCFYCGNKMFEFEPRDCPFEEHAVFFPLCDYIRQKRGVSYVERISKESPRIPHAKQIYEMDDNQIIKVIYFDKTGPTPSKNGRSPARRILTRPSPAISKRSVNTRMHNLDVNENSCCLCCDNAAKYEYHPCQHCPMCGECFAKLTEKQYEECLYCKRPAVINLRVLV